MAEAGPLERTLRMKRWLDRLRRIPDTLGVGASHLVGWALPLFLVAFAPVLTVHAWLGSVDAAVVVRHATALFVVIAGGAFVHWRRKQRPQPWPTFSRQIVRRCAPVIATPALLLLTGNEGDEANLFVDIGVALLVAATFIVALLGSSLAQRLQAMSPRAAWMLTLAGFVSGTAVFAYLGIARHQAMLTNTYDLGIFENVLWNLSHGRWMQCHVFASGSFATEHFAPALALLVPAYLLAPRTETLVILQAAAVASAAIPIHMLAVRNTKVPLSGAALSISYLLSPMVAANALWDFHVVSIGIPVVLWTLWCFEAQRPRAFALSFAVMLLLREEYWIVGVLLGLYAASTGRRTEAGWLLLASCLYGLVVARIAPDVGLASHGGDVAVGDATVQSFSDLVSSLFSDPQAALGSATSNAKLGFSLLLLAPLLLLPLLGGASLLLWLFGLAVVLLAANPAVSSPYFHYSAFLVPFAYFSAAKGLPRITAWSPSSAAALLAVGIVVASLCIGYSFGLLDPDSRFRAGYHPITWSPDAKDRKRLEIVRTIATDLDASHSVSASGRLGPHLARRPTLYRFPDGIDQADAIVIWRSDLSKTSYQTLLDLARTNQYETTTPGSGILLLHRRVSAAR